MLITILIWVVFGAIAGWIAGSIMKLKSTLLWTIILGIIGSFVGGFVASLIGFGSLRGSFSFDEPVNLLISLLIAVAGACIIIILARILKIVK